MADTSRVPSPVPRGAAPSIRPTPSSATVSTAWPGPARSSRTRISPGSVG
jgi:hypothetical protein